jgi:proline dehydrogenase
VTLLDKAIVRMLPVVPKPVVQLFSSRYIAGSTLDEAVQVVRALNRDGKMATIDVLGEEITRESEARAIAQAYCDVFTAIEREYRELRESGFDNVGVVLQAYLRRTLDDVLALADLKPNVRLCKGIYVEPPSIAFTDDDAVRANYVHSLDALLEAGAYAGIATHDEWLIGEALKRVAGMSPSDYEFQMLLGVREQRADELVATGHRLRVYVPFGEHWYQYSLRRLQENPAMAGTIAKATVGRVLGRS